MDTRSKSLPSFVNVWNEHKNSFGGLFKAADLVYVSKQTKYTV